VYSHNPHRIYTRSFIRILGPDTASRLPVIIKKTDELIDRRRLAAIATDGTMFEAGGYRSQTVHGQPFARLFERASWAR
jgi:hypothetical protein